jgi:phosphoglycerate dehydrogenase-like enzyme
MPSWLRIDRLASSSVFVSVAIALCAQFAAGMLAAAAASAAETPEPSAAAAIVSDLGLRVAAEPVRERPGWKPPHKILVSSRIHDELPKLHMIAPDVRFIEVSAATPMSDIADADAAIDICAEKILQPAKQLQWIQWLGAGVERCVQQSFVRERQPLVTNMQRVAGANMAEHVLGMMLVLSRHLNYFLLQQQRSHWTTDEDHAPPPVDLKGKTLLVAGLGGIGTEVAKRAYAFGMRVVATRASGATGPDYVSYVGAPDQLLELAKEADFIVNCTPLTPQTTGLFNKQVFDIMKPSAYLINVGRGGSVVTDDLIRALKAGKIAGAGLDVTDPEPLPATSPLWHMSNVVITPHVSGFSPMAAEMRVAVVQENLRRYVSGEPMLSLVDIDRGY